MLTETKSLGEIDEAPCGKKDIQRKKYFFEKRAVFFKTCDRNRILPQDVVLGVKLGRNC